MIDNFEMASEFLETMLPELRDDEVFIYFIFVRKKYCPNVKNHHQMVYRNVFKSNKVKLLLHEINKIQKNFFNHNNFKEYDEECYATYIDLNPKSTLNAYLKFQKTMSSFMKDSIRSNAHLYQFRSIKNRLLSSIHKSTSRHPYIMIDIDTLDSAVLNRTIDLLPEPPVWKTETRGGYHLIYNKNSEICEMIYKDLIETEFFEKEDIEIKSDVMTPIVGTRQGGKLVRGTYLSSDPEDSD